MKKIKTYKKECAFCGRKFTTSSFGALYCSDECRRHRLALLRRPGALNKKRLGHRDNIKSMPRAQREKWEARQRFFEEQDKKYAHIRKPTVCEWRSKPSNNPMPYGEVM